MNTQSKPKALLFAMESPTTAAQAESVARNLERVGYACVVCDYAARVGVDPRRLSAGEGGLCSRSRTGDWTLCPGSRGLFIVNATATTVILLHCSRFSSRPPRENRDQITNC